jgi:predicted TIM-barrel fold metal-dependent hydrolase
MWRLDREFELLKVESPWVKKLPSDYIREHFFFSTQPIEDSPEHGGIVQLLSTVDGIDDMLCFSTDYPHITMDDPMYVARMIPAAWHSKVFSANACRALSLPLPSLEPIATRVTSA